MNNKIMGVVITAAVLAAMPAAAHTGAAPVAGFMAGVTHPLFGADHLLAMVTVGLWAGLMNERVNGRAVWLVPMGFVTAMLLGGALGMEGVALPVVELGIAASVIAFGLLLAFNPALPVIAALTVAAVFGVFHGHAHGTEMPDDASGAVYALGFVLATAALHGAGVLGALALRHTVTPRVARLIGGAVSGVGVALLAAG